MIAALELNVHDFPKVARAHGDDLDIPEEHRRPTWDEYFLAIADAVSTRADCRRRKVGCVIVKDNRILSTGYNGAPAKKAGCLAGNCPRGLLTYEELQEHSDYGAGPGQCIALHAEANALLYAGREVRGGYAYITDAPCPDCQKLLAGAGIVTAIWPGGELEL